MKKDSVETSRSNSGTDFQNRSSEIEAVRLDRFRPQSTDSMRDVQVSG
jgi:hypothetical protein